MSEWMNVRRGNCRRQLLTTVSTLALLAGVYGTADAADSDADKPSVWIELGGQMQSMKEGQEPFTPPFLPSIPADIFTSRPELQKLPGYSNGLEGKISFEPQGSDWILFASLQFGRSNSSKHAHEQPPDTTVVPHGHNPPIIFRFSDTEASAHETDAIIDFKAGKDVGFGMFGRDGTSVFSAGVRFAQFTSKSHAGIKADPDHHYKLKYFIQIHQSIVTANYHHIFNASADMAHSFRGVGPTISWDASAPLAGNSDGGITLDWGANAAVLFGKQKSRGQHMTAGDYFSSHYIPPSPGRVHTHYQHTANPNRSRSVVAPNVGGFAGVSFRYSDAKISFGYRGDFFFGAMDGGIDAAKKENRDFYGPFATISVGIP
jgi:hypothetical protein